MLFRSLDKTLQEYRDAAVGSEAREERRSEYNRLRKEYNRNLRGGFREYSKFYKAAIDMGLYWGEPCEVFARCFEAFVQENLDIGELRNTYLVHRAKAMANFPGFYPDKEDQGGISREMRKLVNALQDDDFFEKVLKRLVIFS